MLKNKKIGCLSLLLLSPLTMAMQPLDDQSLSVATGQDGLNIGVQLPKIEFNQVAIIDTDGFAKQGDIPKLPKAALVFAANPGASTIPIGVDFVQTFASDSTVTTTPLQFRAIVDTDKGTGANGAFANIALSFGNNVNGMRIKPFSIYLVPDNLNAISSLDPLTNNYQPKSIFSSGTTLKSNNIKELLRTDNIDIKFIAANKPTMNIQLGAAPQGHMIKFGGAIDSICGPTTANPDGCTFNLVSGATGAKFKLQMTADDSGGIDSTNITGFSLKGFYAGIETNGLVFGNIGKSEKFNAALNNVWLGDTIPTGSLDSNTFNGLQNGSMGSWGIKGASITDLKVKVSGL
ncbi:MULTISPECIES: DUF6160 family protein [unclassified Acinetobacter]|uniref:DUF6160 family protein n=1 Tax=unclassified Acinetobacter TaxID=196816 RepID=UPI00244C5E33|nr:MULTISPECIES: DUF6160 family protein [unclassified Acinetobacter]MDH0030808.1 pilus assembly protein FilA [Acinetobacter sp. GD04021]MDH0886419.1 pilus assembly protein FilA [Acinetobacter sp. GD03873]MDH1082831.1 pilus assembly protein FilA [Acinetobacter sp. GD03983]MDH2189857.1 pilus assembly protein FilA [Acinetobacter sp. GD03645]MDH2203010.1 pilus assembly protein FilA [Acinetobacter sp. GD03647]